MSEFLRLRAHRIDAHHFAVYLILLSVSCIPGSLQAQRPETTRILTREIPMGGAGPAQLGERCVIFAGRLSADNFFEGLEAQETSAGTEFTKDSHRMYEFPAQLDISVFTMPFHCRTDAPDHLVELPREALEKLRIRAEWKTGLKLRPVKELKRTLRQPSQKEWMDRPETRKLEELGIHTDPTAVWVFALTIVDERVPLTDSLVVTLSSSEGKQIIRLSSRL